MVGLSINKKQLLLLAAFLSFLHKCTGDQCRSEKVNLPPPKNNQALLCQDSSILQKPRKPVLVSSWNQFSQVEKVQETYIPRYNGHKYEPMSGNRDRYKGLDLFFTSQLKNISYRIFFQRTALVYLFVDVVVKRGSLSEVQLAAKPKLSGWNAEGWAELKTGDPTIEYGTYEKARKTLYKYVYVFSKASHDNKLDIPSVQDIYRDGLKLVGTANLFIAESDGSASPRIAFKRNDFANMPCPEEMHNQWSVGRGKNRFLTWHPLWDPCYWCTYGHEHGSSPKKLFGYQPKFNLPSTKLPNNGESNSGIKGFAFSVNDRYYIYFSLHAQLSSLRRINTRYHSVNLVVADKTKRYPYNIVADIHYKADFGYNVVRPKAKGPLEFITVTTKDEEIRKSLPAEGKRNLRSINIIDKSNITAQNRVFNIRRPGIGNYEEWRTVPICTSATRVTSKGVQIVLKYPGLAAKSERMDAREATELGLEIKGVMYRSLNLERIIRTTSFAIDQKSCPKGKSGVFYTDPYGNAVSSSNPAAVKQFMEGGLNINIDKGRWEPVDVWQGLYGIGDGKGCGGNKDPGVKPNNKGFLDQGFFLSLGYGVNPDIN